MCLFSENEAGYIGFSKYMAVGVDLTSPVYSIKALLNISFK